MIAWPSRRRRLDPSEAKYPQIKRIDEGIDRPDRIDLIDEVIEAFGQQRRLPTVRTFNEALHPCPPQIARRIIAGRTFSRSQGQSVPLVLLAPTSALGC